MEKMKSDTVITEMGPTKINPNEFDPLQEKNKNSSDVKKEQMQAAPGPHINNTEASNSQPPSLSSTPAPGQPIISNASKPNPQMGEYYGAPANYGKNSSSKYF